LDAYTDLLLQLDQQPKAKQLIERSIQLNPNKEGLKYLNYAEMLRGQESLQMYKKGIQVLRADIEVYQAGKREDDVTVAVRHIGSACASMADLYMTDLCDEPDAEQRCQQALKEAFEVDKDNIEAHQSMANLRLVRNNTAEAKQHLTVVFQQIQKLRATLNDVSVVDMMK
jgi:tetratricopeptide (TPR) repeat protein